MTADPDPTPLALRSDAPAPPPPTAVGPSRPAGSAGPEPQASSVPSVIDLDSDLATEPSVAGGKAAALARAHAAGIRTMPAMIITTAVSQRYDAGEDLTGLAELAAVVENVAPKGGPMIVRSSSVVEDQASSSQAGQFETVLDVHGLDQLIPATKAVLDSRARAGAEDQPIAVLVQPMAEPQIAGVAFGVDPVTGRSDHRVVVAVRG